jgi:argininosuccinate synthase
MTDFEIWFEFEAVDFSQSDMKNEAANIQVNLVDGRRYGINVWTYNFLKTTVEIDEISGENLNGLYQSPPDLFVQILSRECIEKTISDLLRKGNLEDILNPSIIITE